MVASEVVAGLRSTPCGRRLLAAAEGRDDVWLVGGAVRDMLLGNAPRELDVAVEGDVASLAAALDGEVLHHERFGTATVTAGACRYDLARTRTETYAEPGALPDVAPAPITADLARRDVTVNAIAVRLPAGHVECVPHAWEDLQQGTLRVLHDASLADDPTRLWRIARYAARFGFTVDEHTAELARRAGPGAVSGERLGHELRLALGEDDPCTVFEHVAALNPMALPEGFTSRPAGLGDALGLLPPDARRDLTVLAACAAAMDLDLLERWLDHLQFPAGDRDVVAAASRWVTGAPLRAAGGPVEIARAARGAPLEAVALAGGPNARAWLEDLRHVRLEITGEDLLAAGIPQGPEIGRRLQAALERRLAGEIGGREQELRAALEV
jgi:tRNA nucleotidyltransferase (CCA-adding enzyme)